MHAALAADRPTRRVLIAVFLAALVARLALFAAIQTHGTEQFYRLSDGNEYLIVARNLLAGHGFSVNAEPPYLPYAYYVPGYPLLLAAATAIGVGVHGVILLQILLAALSAAALAAFGPRLVGKKAAVVAGALFAIDPSSVLWANQLVTESISGFLLLCGVFFLLRALRDVRYASALAAGALVGLATLVRHATQFLIAALPLALAAFGEARLRRRLAAAALCFVAGYALLLPWTIRNYRTFGAWIYSTATGQIGIAKNLEYYAQIRHGKTLPALFPDAGLPEDPGSVPVGDPRSVLIARVMPRLAVRAFLADPIGLVAVWSGGMVPFFFGDGYAQIRTVLGAEAVEQVSWDGRIASLPGVVFSRADVLPFLAGKVLWGIIVLAAASGAVQTARRGREARNATLVLLAIIGYFAFASGVGGYSRFRYPAAPFILLFSGAGFVTAYDMIRRKVRRIGPNSQPPNP